MQLVLVMVTTRKPLTLSIMTSFDRSTCDVQYHSCCGQGSAGAAQLSYWPPRIA